MKKILTVLPAAALALTACETSSTSVDVTVESSSSVESVASSSSSEAVVKTLPTDYIVTEMGGYEVAGSSLSITKGVCKDKANNYDWSTVTQTGSLTQNADGTVTVDLGDGNGAQTYDFKAEGAFPTGDYYLSSMLAEPLAWGFSMTSPNNYSEAVYPTTECLLQHFGETYETFKQYIPENVADQIVIGCNELSFNGLKMTYVSHDETSIDYKLSYGESDCLLHQDFLYAYSETDCALAFKNYQEEYESGETTKFFNFDDYDQDISADESEQAKCLSVFASYAAATTLAKKTPVSEKQIKKVLKAFGSKLRKQK